MTKTSDDTTFKNYYRLAKPGIIYGNLITAIAGFLFGAEGNINVTQLLAMSVGVSLIIACGCVLNNIIDIKVDKLMTRTKKRELVTNKISVRSAYVYAYILGVVGFVTLEYFTNRLTVLCGIVGLVFYVGVYSVAKRSTVHGTLIGTISGATPPVAGYLAATNRLDRASLLLFLVLVFWQMPHFFAIAIRRISDYSNAHIPVLPVVKGLKRTKVQIIIYILGFIIVTLLFRYYGYVGPVYTLSMTLTGLWWLYISVKGLSALNSQEWAKKVFLASLVSLVVFDIMISVSHYM